MAVRGGLLDEDELDVYLEQVEALYAPAHSLHKDLLLHEQL